jgi:protein-S-isoprenylcysteine O-methyltransferase Ste14
MLAVVAALAPVALDPYGLGEHATWALSCLIVAVAYLGMGVVNVRMPDTRAVDAAMSRGRKVVESGTSLLVGVPMVVAMGIIVLGLRPELDAALYRTLVVLILLGAGATLLELVYSQRHSAAA